MSDFDDKVYVLENNSQYKKIIDLCDEELKNNPNNWNIYFHKAQAEYFLGCFISALTTINKSITLNKNKFNLGCKGILLKRMGDKEGAISVLTEALTFDKNSELTLSTRAQVYLTMNEYANAIKDAQQILTIIPNDIDALSIISDAEEGLNLLHKAIETRKKIIILNPKDSFLHWKLGNLYAENDDIDNAINEYKIAIQIDSTFGDCYCSLAEVYLDLEEYKDALYYSDKAIESNKGLKSWHYSIRAKVNLQTNNLECAEKDINTAIKYNCSSNENYLIRADICCAMLKYKEAILDCEYVLKNDNKSINAYITISNIYYKQHKLAKAIEYINIALKLQPNDKHLNEIKTIMVNSITYE